MTVDEMLNSKELQQIGEIMLSRSKEALCRKYAELGKIAEKGKAVMIGDSIVEMFPLSEFFEEKIYNRGISGDTSGEMLKRLENTAIPLAPKKAVIWVGTNDLQAEVPLSDIAANVEKAANLLKEKFNTEIYIVSVIPVNTKSADENIVRTVGIRKNSNITSLNEKYKHLCEKNGYCYIDVYSKLVENNSLPDGLSEDGLHPNVAGYIQISKIIKSFMEDK